MCHPMCGPGLNSDIVFVWLSKLLGLDIAFLDDLHQVVACFYTVKQCSAINNLSIILALQFFKSCRCNLNLCVTSGYMQKVL